VIGPRLGAQTAEGNPVSRTWKSRVGVVALAATIGIGLVGLAGPAGAVKSDAKDACKGDGWKTQAQADGTPFKNQGECASYVTQGGQILVVPSECFDSNQIEDARLTGPIDTFLNTTLYQTTDGTCVGLQGRAITVVAATVAEADAKCLAIDPHSLGTSGSYPHFGFSTAPANWWFCGG